MVDFLMLLIGTVHLSQHLAFGDAIHLGFLKANTPSLMRQVYPNEAPKHHKKSIPNRYRAPNRRKNLLDHREEVLAHRRKVPDHQHKAQLESDKVLGHRVKSLDYHKDRILHKTLLFPNLNALHLRGSFRMTKMKLYSYKKTKNQDVTNSEHWSTPHYKERTYWDRSEFLLIFDFVLGKVLLFCFNMSQFLDIKPEI